jgi:hypothetical protein
MTPEEQRTAIAEACGWKCNGHADQLAATVGWEFAYQFVIAPDGKLVTHNSIPDYLNDLNAMHEAENTVIKPQRLWYPYCLRLEGRSFQESIGATAAQRAEAFLRTIGEWREAK